MVCFIWNGVVACLFDLLVLDGFPWWFYCGDLLLFCFGRLRLFVVCFNLRLLLLLVAGCVVGDLICLLVFSRCWRVGYLLTVLLF